MEDRRLELMVDYLILGCGYTASRVARGLLDSGSKVTCTNRRSVDIAGANCVALNSLDERSLKELPQHLTKGITVLHSIPECTSTQALVDLLRPFHPKRFVYLSTTGVYGSTEFVDQSTLAAPETERDKERLQTEQLISAGPWSSLILRPAAIYGPHRGVHISARSGIFRSPPGGNQVKSYGDRWSPLRLLQGRICSSIMRIASDRCERSRLRSHAASNVTPVFSIGVTGSNASQRRIPQK